ncbi:Ecp10-1 [Fulvia fulva]|uniref:Ecp10-1 n=1 Tax=Passalora fulva TaxID=5499 RepID=A0A1P8YXP6_PASFU|nr:Ecp10-1 [Fulvia fulva]AQA29217.1 extracellular protein 10-1 [Fulvia fulva]KAK4634661.1 Ecp10-1 [Fulvia fulva]KAK4637069.1 Ecp10-1 [Fulvia fulva]UJO11320.1 Ecp10-1 [Fulvia fulva]WPV09049.1 Ecp10-1 [Fulvia fulva]
MRFSIFTIFAALVAGGLAQSWNCDTSEQRCINRELGSSYRCSENALCKKQGNGCSPVTVKGRIEFANCSA